MNFKVKIDRLLDRKMNEGYDPNAAIQRRKDFRNPSIYEKLIQHLEIDEIGSNFPKVIRLKLHCCKLQSGRLLFRKFSIPMDSKLVIFTKS